MGNGQFLLYHRAAATPVALCAFSAIIFLLKREKDLGAMSPITLPRCVLFAAAFGLAAVVAAAAQAEAPKPKTLWEAADLMVGEAAYEKGDYAKAARYFRIAAERNNAWSADAQRDLGVMYYNGLGVPQDYTEALKWYRKAAEQGNERALGSLGLMYERGQGVPQDCIQAYMWFNLAASRSHPGEGREAFAKARDDLATRMTPAQIGEAQRLASDWRPTGESNVK
jgi:uncharacterized protein